MAGVAVTVIAQLISNHPLWRRVLWGFAGACLLAALLVAAWQRLAQAIDYIGAHWPLAVLLLALLVLAVLYVVRLRRGRALLDVETRRLERERDSRKTAEAALAAAESKLAGRWVNDDAVEWDSSELTGMPLGAPLDYVYETILKGKKWFQPIRLKLDLAPAAMTAEAQFTEWTDEYNDPITAVLSENGQQLELRHWSAMSQGREVKVVLRLSGPEVARTHHLRVLNVRRYRESGS